MRVAHVYTRWANHLYTRFPGRTEDWYVLVEERSGEKNGENKVAQDRGSIADIFAFRNAADAIYENVVPEWRRKTGKKKDILGRVGKGRGEGEGENCLFYGVELRRTILSPTKWPGSIFDSLSSLPHSPPSTLSLSLSFFFARTPFSLCVFHEQRKFPPKKSTVQ